MLHRAMLKQRKLGVKKNQKLALKHWNCLGWFGLAPERCTIQSSAPHSKAKPGPDMNSPKTPPNETWWERELLRNQKLTDQYFKALGNHPDWEKWSSPEDFSNQLQFSRQIEMESAEAKWEISEEELEESEFGDGFLPERDFADEPEEDGADPENYQEIAQLAREFAIRIFQLEELPENAEIFYLSAGKVGANLAGGHGLGYEDETICGNIVKCRWALADCEFCREMLEHLHQRTGRAEFVELLADARSLADSIKDRISRLRSRVWWAD